MSGAEITVTNTATHTADTPQLLLEHHLKELRLPTILREYDKVARQCAVEQLDYQRYLLRMTELELLDRERRGRDSEEVEAVHGLDDRELRLPDAAFGSPALAIQQLQFSDAQQVTLIVQLFDCALPRHLVVLA